MKPLLIIASADGIQIMEKIGQSWRDIRGALINHRFTAVYHNGENILAGAEDGLYLSRDFGQTWREADSGLAIQHIRSVGYHPHDPQMAVVGTEPAAIFKTYDGGDSWQECPEVADLRDRYGWFLPYSPNAGCVRGFAFYNERAYAAVEQGGLLHSNDSGKTWHLMEMSEDESRVASPHPWIHPDVHSVLTHPSSPSKIFAATGGGLYYSISAGRSWSQLHRNYCRAVWVDPLRADHLILGPADGPDRNGRIEESFNGGETWDSRMAGLEFAWTNKMVEQFVQLDDELFAVLSDGELISASLDAMVWRSILGGERNVRAIAGILEQ